MNQRNDDNPFRGHDFCILGDDGKYYRITNEQLVNSQWEPSEPVKEALDKLLIKQGSILALHPRPEDAAAATTVDVDPDVAIICLLLNFRSLRTRPPEDED